MKLREIALPLVLAATSACDRDSNRNNQHLAAYIARGDSSVFMDEMIKNCPTSNGVPKPGKVKGGSRDAEIDCDDVDNDGLIDTIKINRDDIGMTCLNAGGLTTCK